MDLDRASPAGLGTPRRKQSRCPLYFSLLPLAAALGRLPEWPKGAVCKTVGSAYVGSNPTPATTCGNGPPAAETRPAGRFLLVTPCIRVCHRASRCRGVHGRIADGVRAARTVHTASKQIPPMASPGRPAERDEFVMQVNCTGLDLRSLVAGPGFEPGKTVVGDFTDRGRYRPDLGERQVIRHFGTH